MNESNSEHLSDDKLSFFEDRLSKGQKLYDSFSQLDASFSEEKYKDICIFSGNSNPKLAKDICERLGVPLGEAKMEYFANTEARPVVKTSVRCKHVFIVQTGSSVILDDGRKLSVNDILMEMLLLTDACKRSGCRNVTLLMPCYAYARQDKKDSPRAAISARLVSNMIMSTQAVKRLVCVELHNACIQGFFNISVDNLYTIDLVVDYLKKIIFPKEIEDWLKSHPNDSYDFKKQFVVVAPDEGAFKRSSVFADKLKLPFLGMSKTRDYSQRNKVAKNTLLGDKELLQNRTALILDDMLDTGGTIIKTVQVLKDEGVNDVIVCVTHGILSNPAIERINNCNTIKYLVVSDSLDQSKNYQQCPKLRVFTLADLYAEVVKRLVYRESISDIFV